ncbi:MAG: hypothetical protein DRG71_00970 [Deltaproteobacteria bacterium]|nr:MAG: hypothetical protein DRG71_00970 [Deltaproteobacteria bacterium]HDG97752.1 CoB--CoM heterodisulfide reductase iron-sulfur subunit A family protein [Desulfobacterales bacterium]
MQKEVIIVIGGGITGLTVALELARLGKHPLVVERGPLLGGRSASLPCKATDRCLKCNNCLVEDTLRQIKYDSPFEFMTHTTISDIRREAESWYVTLETGPFFIDWEKCTDCGACYEACARLGASGVVRGASINQHPFFGIDQKACSCLQKGANPACVKECPEGAINILARPQTRQVKAHGIVVATGYTPYVPPEKNRFGYGRLPNVITTQEADEMLRESGAVTRPSDGRVPQRVAFVQCVGSRDRRIGREYCSRICCGYSLRLALHMIHKYPDVDITIFYMDIQNFGKDFEKYYSEVKDKAKLVRGLPGDFYALDEGKISVSYFSEEQQKNVAQPFDLVLLTIGLSPQEENPDLANMLGLGINEDGFLRSSQADASAVVVAGTARGPMDVAECICDAKSAAFKMANFLEGS